MDAENDTGADDREAAGAAEPDAEAINRAGDIEDSEDEERDDSGVAAVAALLVGLLGFLGAVAFVLLRRALFNV